MNLSPREDQFIQLNRTFHQLPESLRDNDNEDLSGSYHFGSALVWSDLLKRFRVVILSEAGSGKTEEIRQAALKLREQEKAAFFLRLEHIPDDLELAFEVGAYEEFTNWLSSNDEAWILLDSVDEARLRNPADFERALRKLGHRIQSAMDRSHISITGRSSAWRPKTDFLLCQKLFPITQKVAAESSSIGDEQKRLRAGATNSDSDISGFSA